MNIKSYIKNIILAVVLIVALSVIGVSLINDTSDMELSQSTYTRTSFDYYVGSPSKQQMSELNASGTVQSSFPFYAQKFTRSKSDKVTVLISDKMDNLSASVFTQDTLVEGEPSSTGIMLDVTAAEAWNVSVGDSITISVLGVKCTKRVAAIYLPCTLAVMDKGVAVVSTDGLSENELGDNYDGAFVVANDRDALGDMLTDFVGEGYVTLTLEEYIESKCSTKLPNQTDEDYMQQCTAKYEQYRQEALASAKKDAGRVVDKQEAYKLIQDRLATTQKGIARLKLLGAIAGVVVFVVVSVIFVVTNAANDRIRRDNGLSATKMTLQYVAITAITAVVIVAFVAFVLGIVASGTYFAAECIGIILALSLPVLAGIIPVAVVCLIYVSILYGNSAK